MFFVFPNKGDTKKVIEREGGEMHIKWFALEVWQNKELRNALNTVVEHVAFDPNGGKTLGELFFDVFKPTKPLKSSVINFKHLLWKCAECEFSEMDTAIKLNYILNLLYENKYYAMYFILPYKITRLLYFSEKHRRPICYIPPVRYNPITNEFGERYSTIGECTQNPNDSLICDLLCYNNDHLDSYSQLSMASVSKKMKLIYQNFLAEITTQLLNYTMSELCAFPLCNNSKDITEEKKKIVNITPKELIACLETGNYPYPVVVILAIICMKKFDKGFEQNKYSNLEHMILWEQWSQFSVLHKCFVLKVYLENLKDNTICSNCGHIKLLMDMTTFYLKSNAHLSGNYIYPIYRACDVCIIAANSITCAGWEFFSSMLPFSVDVLSAQNQALYLFPVFRFLKSSNCLTQRHVTFSGPRLIDHLYNDVTCSGPRLIDHLYNDENVWLKLIKKNKKTTKNDKEEEEEEEEEEDIHSKNKRKRILQIQLDRMKGKKKDVILKQKM